MVERVSPHPMIFLKPPNQSWCPMGQPHLKMKPPPLKSKPPLPEKKQKMETIINTCVSLIKQHWKKMAKIPQKHDFLHSY